MLEAHKEAATTTTDFLSNSFSVSILLFSFTLYCSIFSDSASNWFGWMGAGWAGEGGGAELRIGLYLKKVVHRTGGTCHGRAQVGVQGILDMGEHLSIALSL